MTTASKEPEGADAARMQWLAVHFPKVRLWFLEGQSRWGIEHLPGAWSTLRDAVDAARGAQPQQSLAEAHGLRQALSGAIEEALMHANCAHTLDEDDEPLPTVDKLSAPGSDTIETGRDEVWLLRDVVLSTVEQVLRERQVFKAQPKGMPAEWLDAFEEWRQTLGAADLDGKRDLVWRHIAGTGFQAGAAWARSQAPAPGAETDDKPKATAYEYELERLIHDFVRTALVGSPSEATLHHLDQLIDTVRHPTINRNLRSMRRQVTNPRPPCPPFASCRRSAGAEIASPAVPPALTSSAVAGVDYERLVTDAWALHKYRCGTPTCIAFKRGAEWQAAASKPPVQGNQP